MSAARFMEIALVAPLGAMDTTISRLRPNSTDSPMPLRMEARTPAVMPSSTGSALALMCSNCRYKGTASATMAGPMKKATREAPRS